MQCSALNCTGAVQCSRLQCSADLTKLLITDTLSAIPNRERGRSGRGLVNHTPTRIHTLHVTLTYVPAKNGTYFETKYVGMRYILLYMFVLLQRIEQIYSIYFRNVI